MCRIRQYRSITITYPINRLGQRIYCELVLGLAYPFFNLLGPLLLDVPLALTERGSTLESYVFTSSLESRLDYLKFVMKQEL